MSKLRWVGVGLALVLVLAGCQKKTDPVVTLRPTVAWEHLSPQPIRAAADGFVNLAPDGTDGVFPASIAVARVTAAAVPAANAPADQASGGGALAMDMAPANDFLPWTALFDSLQYIPDAFPMHGHDLSGEEPTAARLVQAAKQLRAGLCLVYSEGDVSAFESLVRGVVYDTRTGRALATIETQIAVPNPESVPHPPEQVDDDVRHCDPRFLADRRFEQLVFDCIRDLKSRDRPAPPQPQEGWLPEGPVKPRNWPPVIGTR